MAETLTELVAKITTDAAGLKSGLSDAEKQTEASSKKMQDSLKKVGMAMAASGAAITAALGLMGKAAIDEDINMKRLATTINNSGTAYDSVKDSMEALIATTQRKTGIADNEQRDAIGRLVLITKDYNKAIELLPTVLDLAAASEMDVTTASTYLSKAYLDLEAGAEEVSVRFGMAAIKFKSMEDIQNRVKGAAENLANPLNVLKVTIGDVDEEIGKALIPLIKDVTGKIVDIAIKIQDWVKEHQTLTKILAIVALGLGVILTVVGAFLLILPGLIAGVAAFGVVLHAALGPIGLVSLAIAGIIIVITAAIANWDKLTNIFRSDAEKQKRALESLTEKVNAEFDKQASIIKASYDKQRSEAEKTYAAAIDAINKEYGEVKELTETKIDKARRTTEELKEQYKRQQDAATDKYNSEMSQIREIYDAQLTALNIETDATVKALQDKIDAIDKQTAEEELAYQRKEEADKLATLTGAEHDKFAAEVAQKELARTRNAEKDALRNQIAEARQLADEKKTQIQSEEDATLASLKTKYDAEIKNYRDLAAAADTDLENSLVRIETDRLAAITAQQEILTETLTDIKTAETEEVAALARQLASTKEHVQDINEAYNALIKRYDVEIVTTHTDVYSSSGETSSPSKSSPPYAGGFASGGIVPGPIGMPQLATVHGGETVIPANESIGNVTVNFTQPVFFDREDTMNIFIDKISKTLDRKYRLNGRL
uniref:Putative tail protein n=1 Tax=viral metagenome TaxID=1070528 RepID=A0A6M3KWD5_9ZZZZ